MSHPARTEGFGKYIHRYDNKLHFQVRFQF